MNTDTAKSLLHGVLTERIIGCFYDVYNELGGGFLEAVYQASMEVALRSDGLSFDAQAVADVWYRGVRVGVFRPDLLVNGVVIVELKAVSQLREEHTAQVLHYLRATATEVGLLLNFGPKPSIRRLLLDRR